MQMVSLPPPAYQGMQPQAHVQQRPQAGGTAGGAQEGKGEEHRRAWERLGEAERVLREREARIKGEAGAAEEGETEGTNRPQGGEAQAVEELQRAWAGLGEGRRGLRGQNATEGDKRREEGGRVPHWCVLTAGYPAGAGGRDAGEGMEADQGGGGEDDGKGQGGGGAGAQGAGGGGGGGPGGPLGPPGSGRGHPLHGCGGAVAIREKGQGGGRGGGARKREAAQGVGARGRGGRGGAAASQPQPRADANRLGFRVAAAAAV